MANGRLFTESERREMVMRYESGESLEMVAAAMGRSLYGIYYRLKRLGCLIRPGNQPSLRRKEARAKQIIRHSPQTRRRMSAAAKARGAKHNWYVDGQGRERHHARLRAMDRLEYRIWREAVFERDDYTCALCGKRGGALNADHIHSWRDHPELRYEPSNGRTVCVPCHRRTPTYGVGAWRNRPSEVGTF